MKTMQLEELCRAHPKDVQLVGLENSLKIRIKAHQQMIEIENWADKHQNMINTGLHNNSLNEIVPLYLASVVRYAGWFKGIGKRRKIILDQTEIYKQQPSLEITHNELIKYRDTVFAHPEKEMEGGDFIQLHFNSDGKVNRTTSAYRKVAAGPPAPLKRCVTHTKLYLESIIIPQYERETLAYINEKYFSKK